MADSVDEAIEVKVEDVIEDTSDDGEIGGGETTVVVVDSDGGDSISAGALDVAEQVHEIAQEEAQEAASQAVMISIAEFEARMGHYPTRDEVADLVAQAVAAGVTAAQPVVQASEEIVDEMPPPQHWWFRDVRKGKS